MPTGTVQWFNATRRCDDIAHGNSGGDVPVCEGSIEDTDDLELTEDQRANYEIALGLKDLQDSTVHHA